MLLRRSTRLRRARPGRAAAAVLLASTAGAGAALLATAPVLSPRAVAAAAPCVLPPPICPTPRPSPTHSATPTPPPPPTQTRNPTPAPTHYPTYTYSPPSYYSPGSTPLPTLPPPSPGAPPQPPDLAVQTIDLQLAAAPSHPGAQVLLQATLEAQRDTDTYAVPHATVTFTITSQPGAGAFVDPPSQDSGDTGVVVVTVQTSDTPGDTVVHATAGNAAADITIHADPAVSTPTPSPKPHHAVTIGSTDGSSPTGSRRLLVASLAALLAAMVGGYLAALVLGRLPNPLQRRRVWGRRLR